MSTIVTVTLPPKNALMSPATTTITTTTSNNSEQCCPNCGVTLPTPPSDPHAALLQAQRQIEDLQGQVRLLNQKAAAAIDRWADYEDELSRLRAASTSATTSAKANHHNRPHTPDPSIGTNSPRSSLLGAGTGAASRISQLLSPRKSAATRSHTTTASSQQQQQQQPQRGSLSSASAPALPLARTSSETPREQAAALAHERRLRAAAEEKLAATSREIEDLSASLFEEANAMVAAERRARAALEERVGVLEQRDREKGERVAALEGAVRRIERVRGLLGDDGVEADAEVREGGVHAGEGG
ncbi:hypothetical protein F4861DRAFT_424651 [Xylaria intraflava]|nr:hypothetical protein F4861DRAFT_424651 [Xylaria intraflava]